MSIVAKFGGTSVANAEQIKKVLEIVTPYLKEGVVLVASAMGKTTDKLVEIIDSCQEGHRARALDMLNHIRERHLHELAEITDHRILAHAIKRIEFLCDEMQASCIDIATQRIANDSQRAYILAHGELLSTTIIYALARWKKIAATLLDSREFVKTDHQPLNAEMDWESTERRIQEQINLSTPTLNITQGFIASSMEGRTTTLGRGGSDYSAAIIGAALNVERIEIWTDVDGVLTTDPRIVHTTQPIPALSYSEAAELSYFGATVIHPLTMVPAIRKRIPLVVRNTNKPAQSGTRIGAVYPQKGVRAIATKNGITIINIQSYRMLNAYGFLGKIFGVFAAHEKAVDLIATSEVSISLTIDDSQNLARIIEELALFARVEVREAQGIVSIIGQEIWREAEVVARVFQAMNGIPINLVTLGGSETNLSLVIDDHKIPDAVRTLHRVFFEE